MNHLAIGAGKPSQSRAACASVPALSYLVRAALSPDAGNAIFVCKAGDWEISAGSP